MNPKKMMIHEVAKLTGIMMKSVCWNLPKQIRQNIVYIPKMI